MRGFKFNKVHARVEVTENKFRVCYYRTFRIFGFKLGSVKIFQEDLSTKHIPLVNNKLDSYSEFANRCFNENPMNDELLDYLHTCVGLSGEIGELLDEVKKIVFHSKPRNDAKLLSEAGDIFFYYLVFLKKNNFTLESVIDYNVEKISQRYPNGRAKNYMINKVKEDFDGIHNTISKK